MIVCPGGPSVAPWPWSSLHDTHGGAYWTGLYVPATVGAVRTLRWPSAATERKITVTGPGPRPAPLPECICQICNRKLDIHELAGISYYAHTRQDEDDHEPQPILEPKNWTGGRCDFCSGEPMKFRILCHDFIAPTGDYKSEGDWAACAECGKFIAADRWDELITRVIATFQGETYDGLAANLAGIYRQLRANMIGGIEAVGAEDT